MFIFQLSFYLLSSELYLQDWKAFGCRDHYPRCMWNILFSLGKLTLGLWFSKFPLLNATHQGKGCTELLEEVSSVHWFESKLTLSCPLENHSCAELSGRFCLTHRGFATQVTVGKQQWTEAALSDSLFLPCSPTMNFPKLRVDVYWSWRANLGQRWRRWG